MNTSTGRFATLTAAALAASLLAGCGGGGDGSSGRTYAPGPNGASAETAPDRPRPPGPPELTDPAEDALSTFALDIDTGSYTRFRDALRNGVQLPPTEIRTEEFVNYFDQDYAAPTDGLDVNIDAAVLPFDPTHRLVRVGITSAEVAATDRPDADLVLVVDCSGSMAEAGKMETTKAALRTLATALRPTDRVAMVCYSTEAEVVLEPQPVAERGGLLAAVDALTPQASTNAAAGLTTGYDLAAAMRASGEGRMTRVVLVSDGVANVGETTPGGILERIGTEARAGVNLVSVGVGITTYDDVLLEQLADRGDGWHAYVDTAAEAERVFSSGLTGSLVLAARDAKAQVEFDAARVAGYRLVGYENRAVADEDFRDDTVDGGEVFAGHATTALYDVALREGASGGPLVRATVRYHDAAGEAVERSRALDEADCARDVWRAAPRLHQDLVVALLTDRLTGGPWSQRVSAADLGTHAAVLTGRLDGDPDVAELVGLVQQVTAG